MEYQKLYIGTCYPVALVYVCPYLIKLENTFSKFNNITSNLKCYVGNIVYYMGCLIWDRPQLTDDFFPKSLFYLNAYLESRKHFFQKNVMNEVNFSHNSFIHNAPEISQIHLEK